VNFLYSEYFSKFQEIGGKFPGKFSGKFPLFSKMF